MTKDEMTGFIRSAGDRLAARVGTPKIVAVQFDTFGPLCVVFDDGRTAYRTGNFWCAGDHIDYHAIFGRHESIGPSGEEAEGATHAGN